MHLPWSCLLPVCALTLLATASPYAPERRVILLSRDGHGHGHHGVAMTELNETLLLQWHSPTLPSYWSIDIMDPASSGEKRYPALMALHVVFMSLAFFIALPTGIALRSVKHSCHALSVVAFYTFAVLGVSFSALYKKLTPNMYEGNVHGSHGYFVLLLACLVTCSDAFALAVRLVSYVRSIRSRHITFSLSSFWHVACLGKDDSDHLSGSKAEYTELVVEEPDDFEEHQLKAGSTDDMVNQHTQHTSRSRPVVGHIKAVDFDQDDTTEWTHSATSDRTLFTASRHNSDDTLQDLSSHPKRHEPWYRAVGAAAFAVLERTLVFAGFMLLLSGVVVYTGGCREGWINSCLAHLIKGGIFWCYGLVAFARFLGAFSDWGWAWNYVPSLRYSNVPTAEFVESAVIFLYGATNTWMERFGIEPGAPYTAKQVQHISIAIMFWLAGLAGMGIESKTIRRWLAAGAVSHVGSSSHNRVAEPPSYTGSFNPFPALCIGVTGAALSAHFQPYLFQVQIHALWGYLLCAFAVLRCLTYFFLWLSPPKSMLPSRPPTEALASFFLACGGLVFIFSNEELTIAAMRQGRDDVMMFLNVAVAITCFALCWCMGIVAFKGWLKSRTIPAVKFQSSA